MLVLYQMVTGVHGAAWDTPVLVAWTIACATTRIAMAMNNQGPRSTPRAAAPRTTTQLPQPPPHTADPAGSQPNRAQPTGDPPCQSPRTYEATEEVTQNDFFTNTHRNEDTKEPDQDDMESAGIHTRTRSNGQTRRAQNHPNGPSVPVNSIVRINHDTGWNLWKVTAGAPPYPNLRRLQTMEKEQGKPPPTLSEWSNHVIVATRKANGHTIVESFYLHPDRKCNDSDIHNHDDDPGSFSIIAPDGPIP